MTITHEVESPEGGPVQRLSRSRRALVILLGLSIVILGGMVGVGLYIANQVTDSVVQIEAEQVFPEAESRPAKPTPTVAKVADPVNILLLGSDSRISGGNPAEWVSGAQRTDAIMLLHLPGDRKGVFIMSIPRDSWVKVPGRGKDKINAAYAFGGPPLLIETIEDLTGVHIDHFAIADFVSFSRLTDALGGVEVQTTAGPRYMNGASALEWARTRYTLPGGDFSRVQRQQAWVRAIAAKAFRGDTLTRPKKLKGMLAAVEDSVALDEGLDLQEMLALAKTAKGIRPTDVVFLTAPDRGTGWSPDGQQSIVRLDKDRLAPLSQAFAEDRVGDYVAQHADELTSLGATVR